MRIDPLPLEKEFRISRVQNSLSELSRKELEEILSEAIDKLTRLTHQSKQLLEIIYQLQEENSRGVKFKSFRDW